MSKKSRGGIRESLMEQLAMKGATIDCFEDMVDDYMGLWDIKNKLLADINKRGVAYEDRNSTGFQVTKNNPSVKELVLVNRQMLSILKELNLRTDTAGDGAGDEL